MTTQEFEIRTERMLLRPHRLGDVDDIFEYAVDPHWGRYLTVPMPYLEEHAVQYVARRILASWPEDAVLGDGAGREGLWAASD